MHPGTKQGYVHIAIAINYNSSSSMNHGPEGSAPWLGPAAFASPSLPLPKYARPNTTAFPLQGDTKKLFQLRQLRSQRRGKAVQTFSAPEARGVTWGGRTAFCVARNVDTNLVSQVPASQPLWSFGTSWRRSGRSSPKGRSSPVPRHPFRQAGQGAGTYRAEPAWPEASRAGGVGRHRGPRRRTTVGAQPRHTARF